jgi:thiosulfate dehydrogenase
LPMRPLLSLLCVTALSACSLDGSRRTADSGGAATKQAGSAAWDAANWQAPSLADVPTDSLGASIRRGHALLIATHDSLPKSVGGNLNCSSCHLDAGSRANAAPLTGVFARFPKYLDRSGAVIPLEDRINYCFTRSLAGSKIPNNSREMQDLVAYMSFISRGVPVGSQTAQGMPKMPALHGDTVRGRALFAEGCVRCHGADGAGVAAVPALWGPRSFSVGASMSRQERAASFIRHNMPFDRPGTLTDQQAYDVAAYITAMPRPDSPGKESDWPNGGAPADVPYATKGHTAFLPPPVLPRTGDPRRAIVPVPAKVQ